MDSPVSSSDHDFPPHSVYANFRLWKNHIHSTFAETSSQQEWTFLLNSWHLNQQTDFPIRFPHWSPNVVLYNFRAICDILTSPLTPTTPTYTTHNPYHTVKILITLRSLAEALKIFFPYIDIDVGTQISKHVFKFHNPFNQALYFIIFDAFQPVSQQSLFLNNQFISIFPYLPTGKTITLFTCCTYNSESVVLQLAFFLYVQSIISRKNFFSVSVLFKQFQRNIYNIEITPALLSQLSTILLHCVDSP